LIHRCYSPKNDRYIHYAGRGITVCDRWRFGENGKTGFECFLDDMGEKPTPKRLYSIDRIDNDGNYEPGNCRWATYKQQNNNQRRANKSTTGHKGVTKVGNLYRARIWNWKEIHLGYFSTPEEAASAYNKEAHRFGKALNRITLQLIENTDQSCRPRFTPGREPSTRAFEKAAIPLDWGSAFQKAILELAAEGKIVATADILRPRPKYQSHLAS
jgi:hypothetical protein